MEIVRKIPKEERDKRGCAYCAFAKIKIAEKGTKREYQYFVGCTVKKCPCTQFDNIGFERWYKENFSENLE